MRRRHTATIIATTTKIVLRSGLRHASSHNRHNSIASLPKRNHRRRAHLILWCAVLHLHWRWRWRSTVHTIAHISAPAAAAATVGCATLFGGIVPEQFDITMLNFASVALHGLFSVAATAEFDPRCAVACYKNKYRKSTNCAKPFQQCARISLTTSSVRWIKCHTSNWNGLKESFDFAFGNVERQTTDKH